MRLASDYTRVASETSPINRGRPFFEVTLLKAGESHPELGESPTVIDKKKFPYSPQGDDTAEQAYLKACSFVRVSQDKADGAVILDRQVGDEKVPYRGYWGLPSLKPKEYGTLSEQDLENPW